MHSNPNIPRALNCPGAFSYENGITVTSSRPGQAEGVLEVRPSSFNPHGTVHGGCLFTLADTVCGAAAAARGGVTCVTVSGTLEYLRPATGPRVLCKATPKKEGRTLSVFQVELKDDPGKTVATGTFTFMLSPVKEEG